MRVGAQISSDLAETIQRQQGEVADAARAGVQRASLRLQAELRAQVSGAALGPGLANAWRLQMYPSGRSLHPAGLVFAKAPLLLRAFNDGALIRAGSGHFLAIPTPAAIAMGFGDTRVGRKGGSVPGGQLRRGAQVRFAISKLGEDNIEVVKIAGGRRVILYSPPRGKGDFTVRGTKGRSATLQRGRSIVLFVLIPQVSLRPRLDIDAAQAHALDYLSSEVRSALDAGGG